ncbi:MAG: FdhF/YdeP family oxidoreductase [Phycisphaerales bacterium]|nr:FdhF/YdeP family oxidoreductase [Phycisphaerales bacterium]
MRTAGGWHSILYSFAMARRAGGMRRMWKALRAPNACKTCALGMGGAAGGMVNEAGHFPEVCKKSIQAMQADLQGAASTEFCTRPIAELARWTPRDLERAGRLTTPLVATDGAYRPVPWDEALDLVADAFRRTVPDRSFFYFSGRSSNEAGFLLQLVARLWGTNNVNNCSYFCHQASGVGLTSVTGSGTATIRLEDLDACDLLFLIGGNPASNHPRFMRTLMQIRRRHGQVVVVNPMKEPGLVRFSVPSDARSLLFGSDIATRYAQVAIGGDQALLVGLAKRVVELDALDHGFIRTCTEDADAFIDLARDTPWAIIESRSGISRAEIHALASMYASSKRTIFAWTMGVTHHARGVDTVRMIANLALLRGMVGRPGTGLLPLRGHSNVQGIGSVGAVPALKGDVARAIETKLGVTLPTTPGLDTMRCIEKAADGGIDVALHLGGNLFGSAPDAAMTERALARIGTTVFLSTTMNTGHLRGRGATSVILPVRARDEEDHVTTQESMFNYVRRSMGGPSRYDGPRSETDVIVSIASRLLDHDLEDLRSHDAIRALIADVIPGYAAIREDREFHIDGRTFHTPRFATPTGRARFHAIDVHDPTVEPGDLRLMTIRSEGQFNTVVYEDEDVYRGTTRRDVILMHVSDLDARHVRHGDPVEVTSSLGSMRAVAHAFDIAPGNAAMFYPEVNGIVPATVDPQSRTPSFKDIRVRVARRLH